MADPASLWPRVYEGAGPSGTSMKHIRWTFEQLEVLREQYPLTPNKILATMFQRSESNIRQVAHHLGLRKIGHPGYVFPEHARKYTVDVTAFDPLTERSAYVLGFILADGCLCGPNERTLKLSITDLDILIQMRSVLGSNHPISKEMRNSTNYPALSCKPMFNLVITHQLLADSLLKFGITPRKTFTATLPPVPDNLFSHLLRGYFDGDGYAHYSKHNGLLIGFTSASELLLHQLSKRIADSLGLPERPLRYDRAFRLSYGSTMALRIADAMYADCGTLYLPRKKVAFDRYRENRQRHPTN